MALDLLLDLDDELMEALQRRATDEDRSVEELMREALTRQIGRTYQPLSAPDLCIVRPIVHLDLRTA